MTEYFFERVTCGFDVKIPSATDKMILAKLVTAFRYTSTYPVLTKRCP